MVMFLIMTPIAIIIIMIITLIVIMIIMMILSVFAATGRHRVLVVFGRRGDHGGGPDHLHQEQDWARRPRGVQI